MGLTRPAGARIRGNIPACCGGGKDPAFLFLIKKPVKQVYAHWFPCKKLPPAAAEEVDETLHEIFVKANSCGIPVPGVIFLVNKPAVSSEAVMFPFFVLVCMYPVGSCIPKGQYMLRSQGI